MSYVYVYIYVYILYTYTYEVYCVVGGDISGNEGNCGAAGGILCNWTVTREGKFIEGRSVTFRAPVVVKPE